MKKNVRLMVAVLTLVMAMSACQPTPEEEPVVNKGDRVLEEKISAVAPTQSVEEGGEAEATSVPVFQYTFPDRWDEVYDAGNDLVLTFNADIIQKEDGVYPVYRTKAGTVDKETMEKVLDTLLPAPVSVHSTGMTKDDWKAEMERYIEDMEERMARLQLPPEERGDGDDTPITQEEIDEQLKLYAERMAEAPDTLDEVEVTDFSTVQSGARQVYRLSDGDTVYVSFNESYWSVYRSASSYSSIIPSYSRWEYEDEGMKWKDVTIAQEDALAQGREVLDKLGYEDFALVQVYEANYGGDSGWKNPISGGYIMTYKRDFGGYPLVTGVEPSQHFNYGEDDSYNFNSYIYEEYIEVYVDETGVRYMYYTGAKSIIKEENPSVELLDFETIQERVRKMLTYGLTGLEKKVEIYKIVLTANTQRVAGSEEYYEVPCWIVYYDATDYSWCKTEEDLQRAHERIRGQDTMAWALYINAIDGTVFSFDYGR